MILKVQCKTVASSYVMLSQYFSITIFMQKVLKNISLFPLDNIHKHEAHEKGYTVILGSKSRRNMKVIHELIHKLDITGIIKDINRCSSRPGYTSQGQSAPDTW